MKYCRPKYRNMKKVVDQCMKINGMKAMFYIVVFSLLLSLVFSASMLPMLLSMNSSGAGSEISAVATEIILIVISIFVFMLLYGMNVLMSRIVEKSDEVGFGLVFSGFSGEKSKKVFFTGLIFTAIFAVIIVAFSLVFAFNRDAIMDFYNAKVQALISEEGMEDSEARQEMLFQLMEYAAAAVSAVLFLFMCPFIFSMLFIYSDPSVSAPKAFGKSAALLWGRFFHFIGFELFAGSWWLLIYAVCLAGVALLPENFATLAEVLSFVSIPAQLYLMPRMAIAVPVYFYSATGRIRMNDSSSENNERNYSNGNTSEKLSADVFAGNDVEDAEVISISDGSADSNADGSDKTASGSDEKTSGSENNADE